MGASDAEALRGGGPMTVPATEAGRLWGRRAGSDVEMVGALLRSVRVNPAAVSGGAAGVGAGVFGGGAVLVRASSPRVGCVTGATSGAPEGVGLCVMFASPAGASTGLSPSAAPLAAAIVGVSTSISSVSSIWIIGAGGLTRTGPGVLAGISSGADCADLDGVASTRLAAA